MSHPSNIAPEVLGTLSVWAPWIWSGSSVLGLIICVRLWHSVRSVRRDQAWKDLDEGDGLLVTLLYFERLAITGGAILIGLAAVGMGSVVFDRNVWVSIATLLILLALPSALTWLVYRAFRLRLAR